MHAILQVTLKPPSRISPYTLRWCKNTAADPMAPPLPPAPVFLRRARKYASVIEIRPKMYHKVLSIHGNISKNDLRHAFGLSWTAFGESWAAFGASWAAFGAAWGGLGRPLGRLGRLWGRLGRHLGSKIESKSSQTALKNQGCFLNNF